VPHQKYKRGRWSALLIFQTTALQNTSKTACSAVVLFVQTDPVPTINPWVHWWINLFSLTCFLSVLLSFTIAALKQWVSGLSIALSFLMDKTTPNSVSLRATLFETGSPWSTAQTEHCENWALGPLCGILSFCHQFSCIECTHKWMATCNNLLHSAQTITRICTTCLCHCQRQICCENARRKTLEKLLMACFFCSESSGEPPDGIFK